MDNNLDVFTSEDLYAVYNNLHSRNYERAICFACKEEEILNFSEKVVNLELWGVANGWLSEVRNGSDFEFFSFSFLKNFFYNFRTMRLNLLNKYHKALYGSYIDE